ncbi:uncharacterized protein MONOS_8685 [Monocercomonoides exilis]|uniref:uncharacterized protein n=1 Tax=Monocercomonoides exilis TaxID=2049356 RepID=UPI00355A539F|nr:hypothetical protein MONOS_8685 [Monocercomonoides exilis]|eukprot:MONOS_8685.1-p1 / transcript=MONOS_8685.1 / gene=MONOS_8685 / organism=Monocercomonoides_exilis_PA203 / gene_product=unspecified product / transcript_product=unspecified product / location=Mono_scaffold00334:23355-24347(+) / protein_length=223 / sequence_SO=supercontig / SO=protein_coding / is_pseudo=false
MDQMEKARVIILLPSWKGQNWDILLRTSNYCSLELNYNSKILREGPWMKKTGACLPPGKMKAILLNPSRREVKPGGCTCFIKEEFPWSSRTRTRLALHRQRGRVPNNYLSFKERTTKDITLKMLLSVCCFTKLERVNMENSRFEDEGVYLDIALKTSHTRTNIAVPFLPDIPFICPASATRDLWTDVQQKQKSKKLLLNTTSFQPLSASGIRKLAKEAMKAA